MFNVQVPSNIGVVSSILVPLAQFDLFEELEIPQKLFNFDYDIHDQLADEIPDQIKELGYETHNCLLNLGGIFIFIAVYIA